jgi:hypothetical protein
MISPGRPPEPRRGSATSAALQRDAALNRISRTRRWLLVATAGLTALFAGVVASITPKKVAARTPGAGLSAAGSRAARPRSKAALPPLASAAALGLQAPGSAPQAAAPVAPSTGSDSGTPAAPSTGSGGGTSAADAGSAAASAPAPAPSTGPAAVSGGS